MVRHFLSLQDFSREELAEILSFASELKKKQAEGVPHKLLAGKTLGMLFDKSSTRTRVSFEVGMTQLGGHAIFLSPRDTQIGRGEPIKDTARVLSRYLDMLMIRTYSHENVEELARWSSVPVINGLTDRLHPCQVMADLLTVIERLGTLDGVTVAWVGDGNNMSHSWIEAAAAMGFTLRLACPPGYLPSPAILGPAREAGAKITIASSPAEAVRGADVVTTDVWTSMGQEEEKEQRKHDFAGYIVDEKLLSLATDRSIFLHCLPAYRGEEVSDGVMESKRSAVWDQAENRLHIQKAIIVTLFND
jgi:ornithine carbamoyltransferase